MERRGNVSASTNEVLSPTLLAKEKLIGYRDKEPNNASYNADEFGVNSVVYGNHNLIDKEGVD
ncbi:MULTISPECIES: hypothetical protein [unclassified Bacillus (in: firmicutes)]|uniref:hypothetical protein n=1 Tax=unclassified Bacillus (in: firmicutes) TaxID=185979 RepID=UPI001912D325|nr:MULTISPECIES: hypothetical protein [unclassified Bacillus (in: firmicutes)]MBK5345863.1 hypothetical protein [Bacillus sp. TH45]MBK5360521.1 hypothetical protein [Bacillus sp. TH44]MBK5367419.1 hypothetical protein [Bacillus sp. TH50]